VQTSHICDRYNFVCPASPMFICTADIAAKVRNARREEVLMNKKL